MVTALALAAPALGLQWLYALSGSPFLGDLLCLTVAAFYAFTVANVLGYVLGPGPVTGDKIHAAVAAYILTALLWTALYALVDHLVPGSFGVNGTSDRGAPLSWKDFLSFSFTTLTSTGYGRIVPTAGHAQSLAILEQLAGVFYVAIPAAEAAAEAGFDGFVPDACLINRYEPGTKLSLHQDRNEKNFGAPIVSVSLGLPAVFLFGGAKRTDRPLRIPLDHGDVVVWGGPSRLVHHGVMPLADGHHPRLGRQRLNLTLRKAL